MIIKDKKVALVHDFLVRFGGAEKVLSVLCKMFPAAPVYTLFYDEKMKKFFPGVDIRASFLQKIPGIFRKKYRFLLPLMPTAAESLNLREFDLVISSSSSFVKGIITRPQAFHIAYLHTPTRYLWDYTHNYLKKTESFYYFKKAFLHYLRMWDRQAAERPDFLIANSKNTERRIKKFYRRSVETICPPVDFPEGGALSSFPEELLLPEEYYLIVSYLAPPKKVDLAVLAFNKLELPLFVVGKGPEKKRLRKMAGDNVKFVGGADDAFLYRLYKNAAALIMPQEEDFGLTAVEAQICGTPVLAYRKGGALETVKEGETGEFFDDQTPEVLADGVRRLRENKQIYSKETMKTWASNFSRKKFEGAIGDFLKKI